MKIAILTTDSREHFKEYNTPTPYFGTAPAALLQGFAQLPEVEIHVVSCAQARMKSPEKIAPNIFFHGLYVPKSGWMRTLYQGCIRAVRKKLREIQPDIVHGQGTEKDCAMMAAFSGHPNVITIHGNMRQVAKALRVKPFSFIWLAARLESLAVRRTTGVVCLTRYTQKQVATLAKKTWLIPNAVNDAFFTVKRTASDGAVILCVANLHPYKNQNQLIRALDPVATERSIRLVFVGGLNPIHPYCLEFLELLKTRPWCSFEGFKVGDQLRDYFREANLLVLPSLEDNCPMVVLEAMAAGVPVAASRIGGIPDLIDQDTSGLLFDPTHPEEIRAAVLRLIDNKKTAETMGANGKRRALQRHNPIEIARQHLAVYREVIENSR